MTATPTVSKPRTLEFFAGVGLVRMALEEAGAEVVFANDISSVKAQMYALNFCYSDFVLDDITSLAGTGLPDSEIATASFPCTDLSLAGNRAGLNGRESGLLGEFLRILKELGDRRPKVVMLENVAGFASSNGGRDLLLTLEALNGLGYTCDISALDARHFVPQSRVRLFIVGAINPPSISYAFNRQTSLRPKWVPRFLAMNSHLRMFSLPLPPLPSRSEQTLDDLADRLSPSDPAWWGEEETEQFLRSVSRINAARTAALRDAPSVTRRTAYRRTRGGRALWEIRADDISGCLRTTRGGSSRQALVEGGSGELRVRWMSAREYARLQGAPGFKWGATPESKARFALGDAVCVPAVAWLAKNYLIPLATMTPTTDWSILPGCREYGLWRATGPSEETHPRKLAESSINSKLG